MCLFNKTKKLATSDPTSERHRRLRGILVERIRNYKDGFGSGKDALYQLAATQTHRVGDRHPFLF